MLSDSERARLRTGLDIGALERLLERLTPLERDWVIRSLAKDYGRRQSHDYQGLAPQPRFEDRELQALLDAVWAPLQDRKSDR
jgi:hypothetical protein